MHFRCSPQQNISQRHLVFRRNPGPPTIIDTEEQRGSWLFLRCFSLFLTAQNSEKRLLERTGSARRFYEGPAYLTRRDYGGHVHTMRCCQKYGLSKSQPADHRGRHLTRAILARVESI
jgi:hypothetical protein